MSKIWCAISSHGFGHAAQLVPVLNELGRRRPDLEVYLRTALPSSFFKETLEIHWELSPSKQDIGCIQDGPLHIDSKKTWDAYRLFHENWEERIGEEVDVIERVRPQCVLSNISYLSITAGVKAGCPTMALASLSWDQVLEDYRCADNVEHSRIIEQIRQAYRGCHKLIRPFPGIPMVAFPDIQDVGPVLSPMVSLHGDIRHRLRLNASDRIVLVAFGGIPLSSLPLSQLETIKGYHFLVSGALDCEGCQRVTAIDVMGLSFREILSSADIIMTKPGYATIVEAVRGDRPIVYVRRYNFADEQPLVDFAHRYGRAVELTLKDFEDGRWEQALDQVLRLPFPTEFMPAEGTAIAAEQILAIL
ncbi:MAG: hypothetical protein MRJ96_14125 [Nitrospirales bacterium]|nr:hypothetical protein [Nitrospira sp.]MDR4502582.1 hypothetical protein [Nitrospirales bacterium]